MTRRQAPQTSPPITSCDREAGAGGEQSSTTRAAADLPHQASRSKPKAPLPCNTSCCTSLVRVLGQNLVKINFSFPSHSTLTVTGMSAPIRASAAMLLLLWQHADGFAPTFPVRRSWGAPSSIVPRGTSGLSATAAASAVPVGTPPAPVPAPTVAALEGWFAASHHELSGGVAVSAAGTLPGVLAQTWASIAKATDDDRLYLFPACDLLRQPGMMETLMDRKPPPPPTPVAGRRQPAMNILPR